MILTLSNNYKMEGLHEKLESLLQHPGHDGLSGLSETVPRELRQDALKLKERPPLALTLTLAP